MDSFDQLQESMASNSEINPLQSPASLPDLQSDIDDAFSNDEVKHKKSKKYTFHKQLVHILYDYVMFEFTDRKNRLKRRRKSRKRKKQSRRNSSNVPNATNRSKSMRN